MNKTNKTKHHRYKLKGLSCASCAVKIEDELKKQEGVRFAAVNFPSSELVVDADDIEKVRAAIKKVEPDVEILKDSEDGESELEGSKREILQILGSAILFIFGIIFGEALHPITSNSRRICCISFSISTCRLENPLEGG